MMPSPRVHAWVRGVGSLIALICYGALCFRAAAATQADRLDGLVALLPLIAVAVMWARKHSRRHVLLAAIVCASAVAIYSLPQWAQHAGWLLLVQHAAIYLALSWIFARTLRAGETPLVSRFASWGRSEPLPAVVRRYTRAVTVAWAVFLSSIAGASLLLFALASPTVWALYLNVLSPALLGTMFVAEFCIRCVVVPREERTGLAEAIRTARSAWAARADQNANAR